MRQTPPASHSTSITSSVEEISEGRESLGQWLANHGSSVF